MCVHSLEGVGVGRGSIGVGEGLCRGSIGEGRGSIVERGSHRGSSIADSSRGSSVSDRGSHYRGSSVADRGRGSYHRGRDGLNVDIGLSRNLDINIGLGRDLLVKVGLSKDLFVDVRLSSVLLMHIRLSWDLLVDIGLSSVLLMDVGLSSGVEVGIGYRGVVGASIDSCKDRGGGCCSREGSIACRVARVGSIASRVAGVGGVGGGQDLGTGHSQASKGGNLWYEGGLERAGRLQVILTKDFMMTYELLLLEYSTEECEIIPHFYTEDINRLTFR